MAADEIHDPYTCAQAWATLSRAHAAVSERLGAALRDACQLTVNDFDALLHLRAAQPDGVRVTDLGQVVRLSQPAVSRMVARLERRGLLARCTADGDRRGVLVALTPEGEQLLSRAIPVHARCLRESFLDHLSADERTVLTEALARVSD